MIIEPNEYLRIETGSDVSDGTDNGTEQIATDEITFSVECHIGIPAEIQTEEQLGHYLASVLGRFTAQGQEVAFVAKVWTDE